MNDDLKDFLNLIAASFKNNTLTKLTLSKVRSKSSDLRNTFVRPVMIKELLQLNFVYRYQTRDITENLTIDLALPKIEELLTNDFFQGNLFTTQEEIQWVVNKKGSSRLTRSIAGSTAPLLQPLSHNRPKQRLITPENNIYLQALGVTNSRSEVVPAMNDKFRQINKFIEIIDSILPASPPTGLFKVADMGSGKGYLTFALYDHLTNNRNFKADITGVEMRPELVQKCNTIARQSGFDGLQFVNGTIQEYQPGKIEMLIALHACDTATDDAIATGIRASPATIIVAPCCHKQVRKAMTPPPALRPMLDHGIFAERQAEMLTDALRTLLLTRHGYQVKTLEFISTEHTPKNVMIVASRSSKKVAVPRTEKQIALLKKTFGIEYHYLETLLAVGKEGK
ncbi:MAG: SAM-dependent methyltransferase [Clostridia bacterium]|nr:SAM-dependent methyltransferase [Clostridia bacterium]